MAMAVAGGGAQRRIASVCLSRPNPEVEPTQMESADTAPQQVQRWRGGARTRVRRSRSATKAFGPALALALVPYQHISSVSEAQLYNAPFLASGGEWWWLDWRTAPGLPPSEWITGGPL